MEKVCAKNIHSLPFLPVILRICFSSILGPKVANKTPPQDIQTTIQKGKDLELSTWMVAKLNQ